MLVGVPAPLIIAPLGAPGTPAGVLAVGALLWWVAGRMIPYTGTAWGFQPVRLAVGALGLAVLASYAVGASSGLPADQLSGADRSLIAVAGWIGITYVAADMLASVASVTRLLRRITVAGALLGLVGLIQFALGVDIAAFIQIPGLTANSELVFIGDRSDFRRVAGTTEHPIEFGVVMALLLPLALHFALADRQRPAWSRWGVAAVIGLTLPMSVSRSAVLGALCGLLVLFFSWNGVRRMALLVVTPVVLVVLRFAIPGLLGTLTSLFRNIGTDPSIQGRTDDYAVVGTFIEGSPIFGRGFGTFLPGSFFFIDNQYLGSVIETGFVGLVSLVAVFVVGFACARGIRLRAEGAAERDLGIALSASVAVLGVAFVTFDGFGFNIVSGLFFLILGCTAALWRLTGGGAPRSMSLATVADGSGR